MHLLRYGRHFRVNEATKFIIGRTKSDNDQIKRYSNPRYDILLKIQKYAGPLVVIPNGAAKEMILLAASICAGYSKAPGEMPVQVQVTSDRDRESVTVLPINPKQVSRYLIR